MYLLMYYGGFDNLEDNMKKDKPLKVDRETWERMKLSLQCKLFDVVEVIDREEVTEKDGMGEDNKLLEK